MDFLKSDNNLFLTTCWAYVVLKFLGWSPEIPDFPKSRRVCIFPHTSRWDFILAILYSRLSPSLCRRSWFVMKPQLFTGPFGRFFTYLQCLPASKLQDTGKGTVQKMADFIRDTDYLLFISPEGKMSKNEWRSGYKHIARESDSKILVCGLDYKLKNFVCLRDVENDEVNEVEAKHLMAGITPLYPKHSLTGPYESSGKPVGNQNVFSIFNMFCICIFLFGIYFSKSWSETHATLEIS